MSESKRDRVQRTLEELEQSYATLKQELAGCEDLCKSVLDWIESGKKHRECLEAHQMIILETLERWGRIRDHLQEMLDAGDDDADWWKHGGEPPDA